MAEAATNTTQEQISPDGQYRWDGQQWVAITDSSTGQNTSPPSDGDDSKKNWFSRHKALTAIGAVAALLVAGAAMSGGGDTSAPTASEEQPAAVEKAAPAAEEPADEGVAGVGDAVRDGNFEFTVKDVQAGVSSVGDEYLSETAQGAYTIVTIKVENIGSEAQMFDGSNQKAFDSQGREFSSDSTANIYVNGNTDSFLNDINPGNTATIKIVFDVPSGESLSELELHDSVFSNGVNVQL